MQELIRKHRQLFAILIFAVIGFPMLFFGSQYGRISHENQRREEASIGKVGDVPLKAADFSRMINAYRQSPGPDGKEKTYADLQKDGTVEKILERMTDGAIITNLEKQRDFKVDHAVLEQQLKDLPDFKDDNGNFDKKLWNEWVQRGDVDWNDIYSRIQEDVSRKVFLDMMLAPAERVTDAEITKELEKKYATYKVKSYKVDPPVTPTEEQIKAHYDAEVAKTDGKVKYKNPDSYIVDYVAFSLQAPMPQEALDVVKEARAGGDFAALADAHSGLAVKNGGEMAGWKRDSDTLPASVKPLFALKPGEVSDPVPGGNGYYIYKVDEERTADDGVREVKARQILIKAAVSEEDRAKIAASASDLSAKAKAAGSLAKAVEEANAAGAKLEIKRTPKFDRTSAAIEGLSGADLFRFRSTIDTSTDDKKYEPIDPGPNGQNIYVAEVAEKIEGTVPPLEEIKDKVTKDTIQELKRQEPYLTQVKEAADKIKAQATNIDEIPTKFPDLTGHVVESDEFKPKDFFIKVPSTVSAEDRPSIMAENVADALEGKEPGVLAGPVAGFSGDQYFFTLIDRKPATEEDKKDWDKERKQAREQRVNEAKNDLMQDLSKDLRDRTNKRFLVDRDIDKINQMLEVDKPEEPASGGASGSAPVEAPAADSKPADAPAAPATPTPAPAAPAASESKPADAPVPAPAPAPAPAQ